MQQDQNRLSAPSTKLHA